MYTNLYIILFLALTISALNGCAGMADTMSKFAGVGVITEEKAVFDNATIVKMSPAWLYAEGSWGNRVKLGAQWSSNAPEHATLVLSYTSDVTATDSAYIGLREIDVNIDGDIKQFKTGFPTTRDSNEYNTVARTIYTESTNSVVVQYSLLKSMVAAKDCRLRIHTSKGYEDSQFSIERIPGGQGTAILSMREFIDKVDGIKNKSSQVTPADAKNSADYLAR